MGALGPGAGEQALSIEGPIILLCHVGLVFSPHRPQGEVEATACQEAGQQCPSSNIASTGAGTPLILLNSPAK